MRKRRGNRTNRNPFSGNRINWKPDVRKHMAVAQPKLNGVDVVTLSARIAKATLLDYMNKVKAITQNGKQVATFDASCVPSIDTAGKYILVALLQ